MTLKKLVVASRRVDASDETLAAIAAVSHERNRADNLTGVLLYDDKRFVQVLEGEHDPVARSFLRIAMDHRHASVEVGALEDSAVRLFTAWHMIPFRPSRAYPSLTTLWRRLMAERADARVPRIEALLLDIAAPH